MLRDRQQLLSKETERVYFLKQKKGRGLYAREAEKIHSRENRGNSMNDEVKPEDRIS